MSLLLIGGAGYIGSHVALEILQQTKHKLIVLDNYCNSHRQALERVSQIVFEKKLDDPVTKERLLVYDVDIADYNEMCKVFDLFGKEVYGVIHLAGLKSITDSMTNSLTYFDINVTGSINLFRCMETHNITNIIFSSSASVYGYPKTLPIYENDIIDPISVYGDTKAMAEKMLQRMKYANWSIIILRYFNPFGAHHSGLLGEHQTSIHVPSLIEIMTDVALGKRETLTIYGKSHDTPDGTPIRDFIHIVDLAKGHTSALQLFDTKKEFIFNLGTGTGTTVLQAINCFRVVCKKELKVKYEDAREGDPPILIANCDKANTILGWKAEKDFMQMCVDYWNWLQLNPDGYT
jgi:UDP-glucose 4-epimerase